ncbi:MAG TPA: carbohydrate kinase family protein [Roseiflexaceae bacterium]|nr:carbohydrate kinase family protein [Roseiflexaceae bacterium]
MSFTVLTVGDLVADVVVALPQLPLAIGHYQVARFVRLEPGGAGNFLIAGVRLGMRMISVGALGDDAFGHEVSASLAREGVELGLVAQLAGTSTTTVIVLNDDHGHTVMTGAYGEGPALTFLPEWEVALRRADAVFAFGYTIREERLREAALTCLERGRAIGRPVFFDPGPEFHLLDAAARSRALACADILLLTEAEIALTGAAGPRELLERGARIVVVKRGAAGCQIWTAEGRIDAPGFPVVARDVAGAGDCFAAAFVYGYLQGWSMERTAATANAAGAAMVQKRGTGRQAPTADELRAVLATYRPELLL